jgi:hypothetical protein
MDEIKALIKANGLKLYEVYYRMGWSESQFERRLKRGLTAEEQENLQRTIEELKEEKHGELFPDVERNQR